MLKNYLIVKLLFNCFLWVAFAGILPAASAQTVEVVPNTNNNFGGILFSGDNHPVIFNNKLMLEYSTFLIYSQMAEYNGDSIKLIPNPDAVSQVSFYSPIIYNNNFYNIRSNADGKYELAKYNGSTYTSIPLLPNGESSDGVEYNFNLAVLNSKLYVPYYHNNYSIMATYNTSSLSIEDGAGSIISPLLFFNNKLSYIANSGIVTYDGINLHSFTNPTTGGGPSAALYPHVNTPVIFKNKMYFSYIKDITNFSLGSFDGTIVKLAVDALPGGFYFYPFATPDMLYFLLQANGGNRLYLSGFNGTSLSIANNPDSAGEYVVGDAKNFQVSYNNNLYVIYKFASGKQNLVKYDGSQLTVIPNPDNGEGFYGSLYVYNNKIYSSYINKDSVCKIVNYDGSSFKFIDAPPFYKGFNSPIEYSNRLYFVMGNGYQLNLMYLSNGTIATSIKSGNWSNPSTWSNNKVPDANTTVTLNFDIVVDINAVCKTLTANSHNVTVNTGIDLKIAN